VWYGVLNYATGDLTYVRAGHELPVLYTAEGALIEPSLDGSQLLGLFSNPPLVEQTMTLASGSTLLLYTDGVIEAVDAQAEMFGDERLKVAIGAHRHQPAQVVCEQVLEQMTAHTGAVAQRDDVTLVCIQAK